LILTAMSYTVLARRYRSQTFDDVVGQEHIARTLRKAIETNRVAHAYLFSGTRGVGKTSMARIFAVALNAPGVMPDLEPHEALQSDASIETQQRLADAILAGSDDLDVIEIDGASNRGVEDARDLIAKAAIHGSTRARFKIYIIDEVHMLTPAAFNTLLKTMEEPPEHVKFILCTTEPHKVLATIQSRCQRFDFRNIATDRIAEHLQSVLDREQIKADSDVVREVARLGAGSMRDALSLLDRLIAAGGDELTAGILEQMLGLPDRTLVAQIVDAVVASDPGAALERADELLRRGIAIDQVYEVLIDHLRSLMIAVACGPDSPLIEVREEARDLLLRHAESFDVSAVTYMIMLCENAQREARNSAVPRAIFDASMARLAMTAHMADVPRLLEALKSGAPPGPAGGRPKKAVGPTDVPSPSARPGDEPAARTVADAPDDADPPPVDPTDLNAVRERIALLARAKPALQGMLTMLELTEIDGDEAVFVLDDPSGEAYVKNTIGRIEDLLRRAVGRPVTARLTTAAPDGSAASVSSDAELTDEQRRRAEETPLVADAMSLFGARIVAVHERTASEASSDEPE
jgi:DNA polymerase-3 subunit gamma/tau